MKNSKNKRTAILAIILLGLLVVAYKTLFVSSDEGLLIEENIAATGRVEIILQKVESIDFDIDAIKDQKFKSLKSIETPLVSLPVGKKNPFSAVYSSD